MLGEPRCRLCAGSSPKEIMGVEHSCTRSQGAVAVKSPLYPHTPKPTLGRWSLSGRALTLNVIPPSTSVRFCPERSSRHMSEPQFSPKINARLWNCDAELCSLKRSYLSTSRTWRALNTCKKGTWEGYLGDDSKLKMKRCPLASFIQFIPSEVICVIQYFIEAISHITGLINVLFRNQVFVWVTMYTCNRNFLKIKAVFKMISSRKERQKMNHSLGVVSAADFVMVKQNPPKWGGGEEPCRRGKANSSCHHAEDTGLAKEWRWKGVTRNNRWSVRGDSRVLKLWRNCQR